MARTVDPSLKRKAAVWVEANGIRCANPTEVANWLELALKTRASSFGTFCGDADSTWCQMMISRGQCVRRGGKEEDWTQRQDQEAEAQR